jgi:transcription initiation factor TFIIH subunit 3
VLSTILVFVNAHLAINHANQVAIIASHIDRIAWLYPTPGRSTSGLSGSSNNEADGHTDGQNGSHRSSTANKYPLFASVEQQVTDNLRKLLADTSPESISSSSPPFLSGAISTALTYANMQAMLSAPVQADASNMNNAVPGAADLDVYTSTARHESAGEQLVSRVLVVSVSQADLSSQYIALMNSVFAAQRLRVPIDILRIGEKAAFLQQASDATHGVFLSYAATTAPASNGVSNGVSNGTTKGDSKHAAAAGLLQTLMMAYLPDTTARRSLVMPGSAEVDFRAACFCHGKVVDLGGVCSVCLSSKFFPNQSVVPQHEKLTTLLVPSFLPPTSR